MTIFRPAALAFIAALTLAPQARAQTVLTITANGQARLPPDQAQASLMVQAEENTAAAAQAKVNAAMAKSLALAGKLAGLKAVTMGYNSYTVTPDKNAPRRYVVQQTLQLSMPAQGGVPSDAFSSLLGTLQQDGLMLNSLSGDLSDAAQRQAQQEAVADALAQIKAQAGAIAGELHEQVGAVKSLDVNAASPPGPQPVFAMARLAATSPPPQSAPDDVQVTASVTAVIALSRKSP